MATPSNCSEFITSSTYSESVVCMCAVSHGGDDDGRLYLTSDAPVRRREATQSREVARETAGSPTWLMRMKTRRRRAPGQIMEESWRMTWGCCRLGMGRYVTNDAPVAGPVAGGRGSGSGGVAPPRAGTCAGRALAPGRLKSAFKFSPGGSPGGSLWVLNSGLLGLLGLFGF